MTTNIYTFTYSIVFFFVLRQLVRNERTRASLSSMLLHIGRCGRNDDTTTSPQQRKLLLFYIIPIRFSLFNGTRTRGANCCDRRHRTHIYIKKNKCVTRICKKARFKSYSRKRKWSDQMFPTFIHYTRHRRKQVCKLCVSIVQSVCKVNAQAQLNLAFFLWRHLLRNSWRH